MAAPGSCPRCAVVHMVPSAGGGAEGRDQRRADAPLVSAIASGSQQRTISAINHRIARSLSVSVPTYRMGAAPVSICRPLAATPARSALRGHPPPGFVLPRGPHGSCIGLPWLTGRHWSCHASSPSQSPRRFESRMHQDRQRLGWGAASRLIPRREPKASNDCPRRRSARRSRTADATA